jgi:hypothetical protein
MAMIQASEAKVEWNAEKKHWQVVIHVGAEVIRRQCAKTPRDVGVQVLREMAIQTARDEGYDLDASHVVVEG